MNVMAKKTSSTSKDVNSKIGTGIQVTIGWDMVGLNKHWMSFIKKIMQKLDVTNEHYWLVVYLPL